MASFADGSNRIGGEYQFNDNFSTWTAGWAHGATKSWYGGLSVDGTQISHGGSSSTGFGGMLGYQFPIADSPLEFCPAATAHYQSGGGYNTTAFGLDGSLGYRITASDNLALVPAAGLRWVSMNTSGGGGSTTETNRGPRTRLRDQQDLDDHSRRVDPLEDRRQDEHDDRREMELGKVGAAGYRDR
jgi:hypothetical protein